MTKSFLTLSFVVFLLFSEGYSQNTGNIPLKIKTKFSRQYGAGDVWGVNISNINYPLVTLDGGLSICRKNCLKISC